MGTMRHHWLVIKAILKRDLIAYFRYPLNLVFSLVNPFVWALPVLFMAQAFSTGTRNEGFAAYTGTSDYVAFFVIGGLVTSYVGSVMWGMGFSLKQEMWQGVLETNWLTPAPVVVQLIGRSLWSLAITTFEGMGILAIAWALFRFSFTGHLLPALLAMIPVLIGLYGLGFGIAAAVLVTNDANQVIDITNYSVQLLSGSQFPVRVLPKVLLAVSLFIPLTYGMDAIRGYLLGTTTLLPPTIEMAILLGVMVLFVFAGYLIFRKVERGVKTTGNMAFH
ncbi:MAG: ABC transporter permease [Bacillota bacterium]